MNDPSKAEPSELPLLAQLHRQIFGEDGPDPLVELTRLSQHGLVLCARDDGHPIGMAVGVVAADELEIHSVAVDTHARGRGIGGALVKALEAAAHAQGARRAFLEVRASNTAARTLYARSGYTTSGRRTGYYRDGEDAIVMHREIPTPCGD
jgi:ribosomal-protein-alanine N-acetyltransferase